MREQIEGLKGLSHKFREINLLRLWERGVSQVFFSVEIALFHCKENGVVTQISYFPQILMQLHKYFDHSMVQEQGKSVQVRGNPLLTALGYRHITSVPTNSLLCT